MGSSRPIYVRTYTHKNNLLEIWSNSFFAQLFRREIQTNADIRRHIDTFQPIGLRDLEARSLKGLPLKQSFGSTLELS